MAGKASRRKKRAVFMGHTGAGPNETRRQAYERNALAKHSRIDAMLVRRSAPAPHDDVLERVKAMRELAPKEDEPS